MNRHFSKKDIHMANKYMKTTSTCSISLIIREMQIKAMKYHFIPIRLAIIKKIRINKCWQENTLVHCQW